jgi:hypothetical protein
MLHYSKKIKIDTAKVSMDVGHHVHGRLRQSLQGLRRHSSWDAVE